MSDPFAVATGVGSVCGAISAAWHGYQLTRKKTHDLATDFDPRISALEKAMSEEKVRVTATAKHLEGIIQGLTKEIKWDRSLNKDRHTDNQGRFDKIEASQDTVSANVLKLLELMGNKADRADLRE